MTNVGRPHYHAIVFGLSADDLEILKEAWAKGFVSIGEVNDVTINYTLGYTQKKYRKTDKLLYDMFNIIEPFQTQSHGIGKRWILDNRQSVIQTLSYTINGVSRGLPRYYIKVLKSIFGCIWAFPSWV